MLHKALQNKWARVLIAVFATFLYALGVNLFVVPMGLYSGGVVGLSQIIRTLLAQAVELPAGVDIAGILYFLINIPVLYLVIYTVFCSLFIDRGHQQNINVQVLIFTRDADPELPRSIMSRLGRGVTYWEGKGAYTESDMRVLCVCVSKFEVAELQETVRELDPHAFFIVQEGVRIGGNFLRKIS